MPKSYDQSLLDRRGRGGVGGSRLGEPHKRRLGRQQAPPGQARPAAPQRSADANAGATPRRLRLSSPASSLSPYDRDSLTPDYRIAPGDVLQVFVWKEADLSRDVRVRPDGYVTVSLLGDLFAVAKTPKGLAAELSQAFASTSRRRS